LTDPAPDSQWNATACTSIGKMEKNNWKTIWRLVTSARYLTIAHIPDLKSEVFRRVTKESSLYYWFDQVPKALSLEIRT